MLGLQNVDWIQRHFALLEDVLQQTLPRLDPESDHALRRLLRRDLPESARCAERVCAALALRHIARDLGDLGWYVAASFVLCGGDWRKVADTLTWPDGTPDLGCWVALNFATRGGRPQHVDTVEAWLRYLLPQALERSRLVDALLELEVFRFDEEGCLVWGDTRPTWSQ